MKPMLIGLCGKAGSGKDSAGRAIVQDFGLEHYAFAAPLKAGLQAMLGLAPGLLDDRAYKEAPIPWLGKSPRQLLQTLGTEWGRQHAHPEIWVKLMERRWNMVCDMGLPGMVITDVRFDNEATRIRRLGGHLIEIVRPGVASVAAHASEGGIERRWIDEIVLNDSTLPILRDRVRGALVYLRDAGTR